jgi:hypothetical protein
MHVFLYKCNSQVAYSRVYQKKLRCATQKLHFQEYQKQEQDRRSFYVELERRDRVASSDESNWYLGHFGLKPGDQIAHALFFAVGMPDDH